MQEEFSTDYLDRFSGVARLYGRRALGRLRRARCAVVGLGGVGSWTAEALARSGVGSLSLVDLDEICLTNVNRQLPALDGQIGRAKAEALAERLRLVNPALDVRAEISYFTEATAGDLLGEGFDCVVDAIDHVRHKALLAVACRDRGIGTVTVGGAGGKSDPTSIRRGDLAFATNDRLLRLMRRELRRHHGFPPESSLLPFGLPSVYSVENARFPWSDGTVRAEPEPGVDLRLNCDQGFGTSAAVTGAFGFAAAAEALRLMLAGPEVS